MMANDFDQTDDLASLSDDELYDLVREQLRDNSGVDTVAIDVSVKDGRVTLSGRVGTEEEVRVAERVLDDTLGLTDYANELMVGDLARGEAAAGPGPPHDEMEGILGGEDDDQSDTAEHLDETPDEQEYGTRDLQDAIEKGIPYSPPDRATPEGHG